MSTDDVPAAAFQRDIHLPLAALVGLISPEIHSSSFSLAPSFDLLLRPQPDCSFLHRLRAIVLQHGPQAEEPYHGDDEEKYRCIVKHEDDCERQIAHTFPDDAGPTKEHLH